MFPIIRSVQQCFHLPYFFSCQSLNPDKCLNDIEITEQIIIDSIQELFSTSAAGPDGVPSSLLLKCAAELAPAFKVTFSPSLTHGFIPSSLKRAVITPVFKSGTKTSPSNYMPISLTSTIIKVFERIIRKQVVAFMNRQGHLNNKQHGFRSGRSCLSALLDVFDDLMHMLNSDTTIDMIYLDFSKAFDKVDHGVLLHKLKDLGITGKLGIWFFQFLTNRTHYVGIPGGISKDSPVFSGVPQGTVLEPLLFLIMISDINKGITSSKLVSFADDKRVYSNIAEADDCDNLQYDLNSIYNWAVHNNMFLTLKSFITFHLVHLCLLIVIMYMPIQIWKSKILQIMSWILAYLCLVTVLLSSTSKTYVKNVQTCLVGS